MQHELKPAVAELLEGFLHPIAIPVLWGDMDAFQHVNNVRYFRYFESSRAVWFEKLSLTGPALSGRIGPILAATSCRYKLPLTYPDTTWTGTKITELKEDRLILEHRVVSEKLDRIAAVGTAEIVPYDYKTKQKAAFPADWIEILERSRT